MINKYTNKQRGLLAVIMAMVMVFAGAALVAAEVDASIDAPTLDGEASFDVTGETAFSNDAIGNAISISETSDGGYIIRGFINEINADNQAEGFATAYGKLGMPDNTGYAIVITLPDCTFKVNDGSEKVLTETSQVVMEYSEGDILYYWNSVEADAVSISFNVQKVSAKVGIPNPVNDVITIDDDCIFYNYVVDNEVTVKLNATVYTYDGFEFRGTGKDLTIEAGKDGKVISAKFAIKGNNYAKFNNLTINGGTYICEDAMIWWQESEGNNNLENCSIITIDNVVADAGVRGMWFGSSPCKEITISNSTVNSDNIGIYLGTQKKANITNTTVDATGTALEIKSGNISVTGGSLTSHSYVPATGVCGNSGSGSGVTAVFVNNGYSESIVDTGDMSIIMNNVEITNTESDIFAFVVAGTLSGKTLKNAINFECDTLDATQVWMYRQSGSETNTLDVELNTEDVDMITEAPADPIEDDTVFYITESNTNTDVSVADGAELTVKTTGDGAANGIVTLGSGTDASTVTLLNFKGTLVISKGSAKIVGDVDSGTVTLTGEAIMVGDVTVASGAELIVADDSTLSIPAGTVLTNNGTVTNNGEITVDGLFVNNNEFVNNGKTIVSPGVNIAGTITGNKPVLSGESFGMSQDLESDYTVKTNAFLEKDLTIPKGVTLTIEGNLNLNGYTLFVEGSLVVEKKGVIETSVRGGSIQLAETGTVSNEGIIGNTTEVTVSAENGQVVMKGVTGIEFSLTKVKDNGYFLTVSGEVAVKVKESNTLTITGAYITDGFIVKDVEADIAGTILKDATVTIGSKAVVTANIAEMQNGSTLIVNGVINGTVNMVNGAEVIINGESDATYTTKTGDFTTYNSTTNKKQTAEQATTTVTTTIATADLKGITISVTTKSYTAQNADKTPMTEQKLLVSRIAAVADGKDKDAEATLTVTGKAYIAEGSELVIPSKVKFTTTDLVTDGLLKVVDANDLNSIVYEGSMYTITVTDEDTYDETVTDYYTTFDAAYATIADADEMTITISGGYKFAKDYVIATGQTVKATDDETGKFTITKNGTITIQDEGALDLPNLDVKGILTVIYGADCDVTNLTYEVMSKNAETRDITYSGAELAIENAVAGDVIDIVDDVVFEDPVTIAEGVTVNVDAGATITAEKGLTVAGKLVNEGTVEIADEYDLIVTGEMENENDVKIGIDLETSSVVQDTESVMTVTGTVVSDDAISGTINAASYTDEDNNIVYTTVASAVATREDVTVSGKFTENADVVLTEEQTLTINGEVVLKSIRLVAGSNLTVNGKLTADVIAAVGTEETTGAISDAVVDVVKITGITNWTVNYNEAKATYTMVMPTYTSGDVVIEAGSVNYDAAATFGNTVQSGDPVYKTMKVASGASLVISKNITDATGDKKYFVNEGTIQVESDVKFENILIGGQVVVSVEKDVEFKNSQITGTVTLSEKDGKVATATITGKVLIGSTPETLGAAGSLVGKIDATAGYVIVFEGSTFQDITEDSEIESTAYSINGIAFATIYTSQSMDIANNDIKALVNALEDVVDIISNNPDDTKNNYWYAGDVKIVSQDIGEYESVNIKLGYESVDVTISVGPGMLVYIDDIKDTDGKESLTIGTHTITVYIEKGYEGTPAITLNGVAVTDGKLVITTDMMDLEQNLLSVTGATVMQDQPVVIQPSDSEKDGMELTDILLIVLVVLIVIMAIIVALRMMRS